MIKRIREKVQNVAYRRRNSAADGSESGSCVSFHVSLVIDALENCTFKGYTFVKYKHRASGNSGSSRLISVADNKAKWGYSAQFNCRIPISEFTAVLNSSWLSFSVFRERPDGYIKIGSCKLNLSEYTHTRSKVVPSQTVRMLLENCEINSILEVRIALKQTGGSPFFKV